MPFLNTILNIIFPVKCIGCGRGESDLCNKCLSEAPVAERESAKWIFPIFDYRHPPVKKALWLFKYKNKKSFAKIFAEILYGKIIEELSDLSLLENFRDAVLIPIPLSPKRHRERGYNQAELICKKLMEIDKINQKNGGGNNFELNTDVLIKPKDTEHQARIKNRSDRLKNLAGSFFTKNEPAIKGRNIILIDDITTTGATLTEAKKTLKKFGARKVIAFTVAH